MTSFDRLSLFIAGEHRRSRRIGEPVLDPATGEALGELPHATREDLDDALASAQAAFPKWRDTPALQRAAVLGKAARLMRERAEAIATGITLESGKPIREARGEVQFASEVLDWYAEEGKRAYGRVVPSRFPDVQQAVLKEPVGVCAAFSPWNVPATTPARKIGGALAAGCTLVLKPSEETPATALAMAQAFADAGLPAGVLNIVFGVPSEVSSHVIASPVVRKISFTGSVAVGKQLAALAAQRLLRTTMELGGNAPVIVCEDADADRAAESVAVNKYRNAGQICISPSRFYVHEAIYPKFLKRFREVSAALQVKPGIEPDSQLGALINLRRLQAMQQFTEDAVQRGARIELGGERLGSRGFFFPPTILSGVDDGQRVAQEEIFGPVVPLLRFSTLDEVIARANAVPVGLAGYVYTASQRTALRLSRELQVGMVGINHTAVFTPETPFGGVKESGFGSEGGIEGLEAYLSPKLVSQLAV
jgi:succinate-semialdehyde dehydrogenase/glutarate-semialdehyde dehydrogenase